MSKKQFDRHIKIGDSLDLQSIDFNSSFEVSVVRPRSESTPLKRKTISRKRRNPYPTLIENITPIKQGGGRWIVSDVPTQVAMLTEDNSVLGAIDLGILESKKNENDGKSAKRNPECCEQPPQSPNVLNWTDESLLCNVLENEQPQNVLSPKIPIHEKIRLALITNAQKPVTPKAHISENLNLERVVECNSFDIGPFFGLPSRVEGLVKSVKNIKKLYEWQEECLNLPALKQRRNLLYALPTSGGKTLVAEILILKEILCHKRNAIFVLPYVSIVQEKVRSMSPFAVELNFLIEEYAGGKGRYPPTRHRKKNTVFIATIEKALGLVNSLLEINRESELGLVVVDELHLVGETTSTRAATLEIFLAKLKFATAHVHIVGMSATIGNLEELSTFLGAEIYTNNFRPVELKEYVKCGDAIWEVTSADEEPLIMARKLGPAPSAKDPDQITVLVGEVVPTDSCLVFCATKKGCENVAALICDHLSKEMLQLKKADKEAILRTMVSEGNGAICHILAKTIPFGVAYHHAGLTGDERRLLEEAFSTGTLCVLCCTSTLAAGVNLPARRVILRSPYVGNSFINLSRYKQMVGRAGRAGFGEVGESFLICKPNEVHKVTDLLKAPMDNAISSLHQLDGLGMRSLVISSVGLGIANSRVQLKKMMDNTLLSVQASRLGVDVGALVDRTVVDLTKLGALRVGRTEVRNVSVLMSTTGNAPDVSTPNSTKKKLTVFSNTLLEVSRLGKAAMKGPIPLHLVERLRRDLVEAQASLVLLTNLHLLYLVTPYDLVDQVSPQPDVYFSAFSDLDRRDRQTAKVLNITEGCLIALIKGQTVRSVERPVLNRFYLTLILNELWKQKSVWHVSDKYRLTRGLVQNLMVSSSTFASCVTRFCEELPEFWAFRQLFSNFSEQLSHCCSVELVPLMELPAVKRSRAKQLYNAGFKTITDVANADPGQVVRLVDHISKKTANQIVAAAKLLLIQKADALREEADLVLEGLVHTDSILTEN